MPSIAVGNRLACSRAFLTIGVIHDDVIELVHDSPVPTKVAVASGLAVDVTGLHWQVFHKLPSNDPHAGTRGRAWIDIKDYFALSHMDCVQGHVAIYTLLSHTGAVACPPNDLGSWGF